MFLLHYLISGEFYEEGAKETRITLCELDSQTMAFIEIPADLKINMKQSCYKSHFPVVFPVLFLKRFAVFTYIEEYKEAGSNKGYFGLLSYVGIME